MDDYTGCTCACLIYHCSKQLPDDWLERMYHSCQHRRPPGMETVDHPETHPMLISQLVSGSEKMNDSRKVERERERERERVGEGGCRLFLTKLILKEKIGDVIC